MEALGLAATCYNPAQAKLLEANPPPTYTTTNIFEIFGRVQADKRMDSAFDHNHDDKLNHLWTDPALSSILLEHWSAWKITDAKADFQQSQELAVALHSSSATSVGGHGYDFLLVHLLTTSHALRILIPFLEPQHHLPLVKEWLLVTLSIYITQSRPLIKREYVTEYDLHDRNWDFVTDKALHGKHKFDAHFVKGCRAMLEAERTWGGQEEYWLKAAVKFADEFPGRVFGDGSE